MKKHTISHYRICERLGKGGMAEVYKALDLNLDREVAIKFLRTDPENFEKSRKRFELEAKALARLDHPNIVRVLDFGEYEGRPYLVMDYIPGGTLKQRLDKPMPWKEACAFLIPIAEALQYAHDHKIIHRDVKPSNILIKADGTPMLSDFGIAKMLEMDDTLDLTGTSTGIGTPHYMAPEQIKGLNYDNRIDIYALGVVLFEIITGKTPFEASTPLSVIAKHIQEPPPRASDYDTNLPIVFDKIFQKVLAKSPDKRYSNMKEFIIVLDNLLGQGKINDNRTISFRFLFIISIILILILSGLLVFTFVSSDMRENIGQMQNTENINKDKVSIENSETESVVKPISDLTIFTSEDFESGKTDQLSIFFWDC